MLTVRGGSHECTSNEMHNACRLQCFWPGCANVCMYVRTYVCAQIVCWCVCNVGSWVTYIHPTLHHSCSCWTLASLQALEQMWACVLLMYTWEINIMCMHIHTHISCVDVVNEGVQVSIHAARLQSLDTHSNINKHSRTCTCTYILVFLMLNVKPHNDICTNIYTSTCTMENIRRSECLCL
jgi:hypothetical protein